tara:strand:- start:6 stop:281 length:276 start_codon:yes stop_codon:yes gene_type:complete
MKKNSKKTKVIIEEKDLKNDVSKLFKLLDRLTKLKPSDPLDKVKKETKLFKEALKSKYSKFEDYLDEEGEIKKEYDIKVKKDPEEDLDIKE